MAMNNKKVCYESDYGRLAVIGWVKQWRRASSQLHIFCQLKTVAALLPHKQQAWTWTCACRVLTRRETAVVWAPCASAKKWINSFRRRVLPGETLSDSTWNVMRAQLTWVTVLDGVLIQLKEMVGIVDICSIGIVVGFGSQVMRDFCSFWSVDVAVVKLAAV